VQLPDVVGGRASRVAGGARALTRLPTPSPPPARSQAPAPSRMPIAPAPMSEGTAPIAETKCLDCECAFDPKSLVAGCEDCKE